MRKLLFSCLLFVNFFAAAQKKNIQPSQLPEGALDFIEGNFRNVALHHCFKFTDDLKTRFKAVMADDTEIEFSEEGQWTEVDGKVHPVSSSFLGPVIIEYIKGNHPGKRVIKARKDAKTIEVNLTDGQNLVFDLSGKFLK